MCAFDSHSGFHFLFSSSEMASHYRRKVYKIRFSKATWALFVKIDDCLRLWDKTLRERKKFTEVSKIKVFVTVKSQNKQRKTNSSEPNDRAPPHFLSDYHHLCSFIKLMSVYQSYLTKHFIFAQRCL